MPCPGFHPCERITGGIASGANPMSCNTPGGAQLAFARDQHELMLQRLYSGNAVPESDGFASFQQRRPVGLQCLCIVGGWQRRADRR
jgi:hypothetical protein